MTTASSESSSPDRVSDSSKNSIAYPLLFFTSSKRSTTRAPASRARAAVWSVQLSAMTTTLKEQGRVIRAQAAPDRGRDAGFLVVRRDHDQEFRARIFHRRLAPAGDNRGHRGRQQEEKIGKDGQVDGDNRRQDQPVSRSSAQATPAVISESAFTNAAMSSRVVNGPGLSRRVPSGNVPSARWI